jgi:hypothetical protein
MRWFQRKSRREGRLFHAIGEIYFKLSWLLGATTDNAQAGDGGAASNPKAFVK